MIIHGRSRLCPPGVPLHARAWAHLGAPGVMLDWSPNGLAPGEGVLPIAPFEPEPLYTVLTERGLEHEAVARGDGAWQVTTQRRAAGD